MSGINLLPPEYQKAQRRVRVQKFMLFGMSGLYLVSGYWMWRPSYRLAQQQEALKQVTYQLQDTVFEEVKALSQERVQLAQTVTQGEARIKRISEQAFPIEAVLYNLLYGMPSGITLAHVSLDGPAGVVILEGESAYQVDIMNRLKRMKSIYPQGQVDFVMEPIGEGGYRFQLVLKLKEVGHEES